MLEEKGNKPTIIRNKIYFASDFHLGVPNYEQSLIREKLIVKWLDQIKNDAKTIFLLGDVFDFWFEYNAAVPKGYVRLLGKLAELTDSGIDIHLFRGNHDMWAFNYFEKEIGIKIHKKAEIIELSNKKFYISHGDGVGPGDYGYKLIKWLFANKITQWLFARLHPNFALGIGNFFSRRSRIANANSDEIFLGPDKERHLIFCQNLVQSQNIDYIIMGHRHLPLKWQINNSTTYLNLGDWVINKTYARFDGTNLELFDYQKEII